MQIEFESPQKIKMKLTFTDEENRALQLAKTVIDNLCDEMYREELEEISVDRGLARGSVSMQELCEVSPLLDVILSAQDEEAETYGIK